MLGRQFVGDWVLIAVLGAMALAGIALTAWIEYRKSRITQFLATQPADDQDARLVWLEDWADRPEIEDNLDRRGPRVPLRGEREHFRHAPHHLTVLRWTFVGTAALVIILLCVAVLPPTDLSEWPYLVALVIGFGASLAYLPTQLRRYAECVEVTDSALAVIRANGRRDEIPWDSIQSVRTSALSSMLVVHSAALTIRIPHVILGYGRLANLIASRLPSNVAWRAV